jgi:hypothetical protein
MSPTPTTSLETPIEGLVALPPSRLPYQANVLVRSFLLKRPAGNVIVYNSPGITTAADELQQLGPISRLLINHAHEAMYGQPDLDAPAYVHRDDRAATAGSINVAGAFDRRQMMDDDIDVIPTPGHTPGTASYLWDNGQHRFLFTGDCIWIENGNWKAVVLDPAHRADYLSSLALVRGLDFDVLVPWGTTDDGPCLAVTTRADARGRIDAIIARVNAGEDR